ncbi:rod shape determining protein RodA [Moryella indoligenes]|uniref:Rod shape determining protein RodA n=1 Tax=Moryella indoligenes TaxID=371674 RepID=A0AAE3VA24_9FIRM|nr:FtsW/RodA/SpoVE family cell cycle protein [Moryella indoligenes]MDQ0152302.1 rod shape determining protein RodA [Moryella indoligenes]
MILPYHYKSFAFRLLFAVLGLNLIGLLVINSASNHDMAIVGRQLSGAAIGITAMLVLSLLPYQKLLRYAVPLYAGCCLLLLLVIVYGRIRGGARRWIVIPGLGQLQPSEFAKIGIILFAAWLLGKNLEALNKAHFLLVFSGLLMIPVFLIASEPDLSTTIVVLVCIFSMIFVAGLSYRWIGAALAVVLPFSIGFTALLQRGLVPFLKPYQVKRILAFLYPSSYADANLQQDNSIMAIGSGQLFGKGLNNNTLASVKNGNFLSEEQTDFIFAVIGEELGFLGCLLVILLYAVIVYECLYIAGKAKNAEGRIICVGFGVLIAFQGFSNIAVATGIFPNTGLTLPFISYGVSSLLSFYMGVGLVLNVGLQRTDRLVREEELPDKHIRR